MTAAHCEVKLAALRRTKDGTIVSLLIHPNDVPDCFSLDPLGQRYMIGIAAIGDDEQPVYGERDTVSLPVVAAKAEICGNQEAPTTPHQSAGASPQPSTSAVVPERAENRDAFNPPHTQCKHGAHPLKCPSPDCIEEYRPAKSRYAAKTDQEKAAVRAVLLCRDVRFQDWLYALSPAYRRQRLSDAPAEECAALWMHGECGIASRREIATDYDAYGRFIALENRYKIAAGLAAEERG